MTTSKGRCQCRAIEYEFEGAPKWIMHCHCASCRRAVSSALATYIGVALAQFRYRKGEPAAYASSPGVKRYFCPSCGTPLAYTGANWPGEIHLLHGTLEDPNAWPPTGHAYVGEQLAWFEVADQLPRFQSTAGKGAKPIGTGPSR